MSAVANIYYYDINGDTKNISVKINDEFGLIAAINAVAAGGNFIQEVTV